MDAAAATPAGQDQKRFFRRLDWSAFWTACCVAFAVYFYTLAPTVTLEDSGELAVASNSLGVPHPPGYPIWTMLSWVFTKLFFFVTFRGQPNPAWSVGLMSAVFGALATGISAMLICRSGSEMLRHSRGTLHDADEATGNLICWTAGVAASLLFAFSPVMWSQSVIVEVYSLNAFFLVLIFLLTYQWMFRPRDRLLYVIAFVFGLGLTNYQVLLLAALPLVFAVFIRDTRLFRDFAILGFPYLAVLLLIRAGKLPPIVHPLDATCFVYAGLNFAALALAWFLLPRGKTAAVTFLMAELGLAFYAYMPIVSDLRNPPMNWGYPRTWEGFKHAITRGQYEKIRPTDVFSGTFIHQIGAYLTDLRDQFTLPVALLGFLPFTVWQVKVRGRRVKAVYVAIALALAATAVIVLQKIVAASGSPALAERRLDKVLIAGIMLILAAGTLAIFISEAQELIAKVFGRTKAALSERITVGAVLFSVAAAFFLYAVMVVAHVIRITAPMRKPGQTISGDRLGYILMESTGSLLMVVVPVLAIAAVVWLMRSRLQFQVTVDSTSQKWIIATLLGFLTMSIMLIALANPKGDIQDSFIQRVKFISSHGLYAFWIGNGLVFGLAVLNTLLRKLPAAKWASLGAAAMLPLVPIAYLNGANRELIRKWGGTEQNGHDFGWQFGNYELRGAAAIGEELDPDEEPLPNPFYPGAMTTNAIFFGGTDPGRFVPTYMIYGARVREDVYLITQNALADNTYMSVMRDLYGDRIWIPSQSESARAFQIFVEEVQSGKREARSDLRIENGRVQVSGALGVMEINGILARMIFDHNRQRHGFYVEESYVIGWMYPFLEPHGLIMKIDADPVELSPEIVRNDTDFWDWYCRRLLNDRKFLRDVVARKSFSKLRSAIAGLYANRLMLREAEYAFEEARTLYPYSPEASFRLAQEVLMRQRRLSEVRELMEDFHRLDPRNARVDEFLDHLRDVENVDSRMRELEKEMTKGKLDINAALELAGLYRRGGLNENFARLTQGILSNSNLPAVVLFRAAQLYSGANMLPEMVATLDRCRTNLPAAVPDDVLMNIAQMYARAKDPARTAAMLERYLEQRPEDWRARVDVAVIRMTQGREEDAIRSLEKAIAAGGDEALAVIRGDRRFDSIRDRIRDPARGFLSIPGVLPGRTL